MCRKGSAAVAVAVTDLHWTGCSLRAKQSIDKASHRRFEASASHLDRISITTHQATIRHRPSTIDHPPPTIPTFVPPYHRTIFSSCFCPSALCPELSIYPELGPFTGYTCKPTVIRSRRNTTRHDTTRHSIIAVLSQYYRRPRDTSFFAGTCRCHLAQASLTTTA